MTADKVPETLTAVTVNVTRSRSGSQLVDFRSASKASTPSPRFVMGSITPVETTPEPEASPESTTKAAIPEARDTECSVDVSAFDRMLSAVSPLETPQRSPEQSLILAKGITIEGKLQEARQRSLESSVVLVKGITIEDTSSNDSAESPKTESREEPVPKKEGSKSKPKHRRTLSPEVNARVLEVRKGDLLGKTVVGVLSPRGGRGHFIKWNHREPDTIFISTKQLDECLDKWHPGMKVTCSIQGIGPAHVQADRQHPFTHKVEAFVPVPARKPGFISTSRKPSNVNGSAFFCLATGAPARTGANTGLNTPMQQSRRGSSFGTGWQQQGGITPQNRSRNGSFRSTRGAQSPRSPKGISPRRQHASSCNGGRGRGQQARPGRGGKPKSNFVFSHSNRSVQSTPDNPMAIGRSDAVNCWRK